jgi:hypothetical protein
MRSAIAAIAATTLTLAAGCDSPLVPGRFNADVYDFALPSTPPAILRWPVGKTIRVFIGTGAGAEHDRLLQESFTAGALAWNALAWFAEFRVTAASATHAADVVLAWSESIDDIVDTSSCQPAFTRAVTTFCVDGLGTDTAHLRTFPPAQTNATSEVKMVVTLLESEALQPDRARRFVAHARCGDRTGPLSRACRHPAIDTFGV